MKFRAALSVTVPVLLCEQVCVYTCLASDAASHEARGNMSAVMGKRGVGILGAAMLATSSTIADPWDGWPALCPYSYSWQIAIRALVHACVRTRPRQPLSPVAPLGTSGCCLR